MKVPFGKWAPDASDLAGDVIPDLNGVLPGPNCKYPWPSPEPVAQPLPSTSFGAYYSKWYGFNALFAGTANQLYRLDEKTREWSDVSNASTTYNAFLNASWRFCTYKSDVVAVHNGAQPQFYTLGTSTKFADVPNAPTGSVVAVWGDQLVIGAIGSDRTRIQGSDINDKTVWSPLATNNAFLQDLPDGGAIMGMTSSRNALVVQERALRRATIVGGALKVRFDKLATDIGTDFKDSVVDYGDRMFFWGLDGFMTVDQSGNVSRFGVNYVDDWMRGSRSFGQSLRIVGAPDTRRSRIYWAVHYDSDTSPDTVLCYDMAYDEWTKLDIDATDLFVFPSDELLLDDLDSPINDLEYSFSSSQKGFDVAFLDASLKANTFTGAPSAARITTNQFPKGGGNRTRVHAAMPSVDTDNATVTVRKKEKRGDAFVNGSVNVGTNDAGWCPLRDTGRYFRLDVNIPAGETWTKAEGVEVYTQEEGVY